MTEVNQKKLAGRDRLTGFVLGAKSEDLSDEETTREPAATGCLLTAEWIIDDEIGWEGYPIDQ